MPAGWLLESMTWVAVAYSLVLLGVAYGIDFMARRASQALERRRNPGFVYHEDNDAWLCPEDEWLLPKSFDPDNRVMRYQAPPSVCNTCLKVSTCSVGGGGREVTREIDPWPASEAARFHRGIACTVTGLAIVWPVATLLSMPPMVDAVVLSLVLVLIIGASLPLWTFLRRSPVDPTGVLTRSADANVLERKRSAAAYAGRTANYRSQRIAAAEQLAELGRQLRAEREADRKVDAAFARERTKDAKRLARMRSADASHCDHDEPTNIAAETSFVAEEPAPKRTKEPRLSRKERAEAKRAQELDQIGSFT